MSNFAEMCVKPAAAAQIHGCVSVSVWDSQRFFQLSIAYCGSKKSIYIHVCVCTVHAWLSTLWAICAVDSNPSALSISLFFSLSLTLTPSFSLSGAIDPHLTASEAPFPHKGSRCFCSSPLFPLSLCPCWDVQTFSLTHQFLLRWLLLLLEKILLMSPEAKEPFSSSK